MFATRVPLISRGVPWPVAAEKAGKHEVPETDKADWWSDVGYAAFGWVRRSRSYSRIESSSGNAYAGLFGSYSYTTAPDSNANPPPAERNAYARATDADANAPPADGHTYTSTANTDAHAIAADAYTSLTDGHTNITRIDIR